jgi:hypothetical protein
MKLPICKERSICSSAEGLPYNGRVFVRKAEKIHKDKSVAETLRVSLEVVQNKRQKKWSAQEYPNSRQWVRPFFVQD